MRYDYVGYEQWGRVAYHHERWYVVRDETLPCTCDGKPRFRPSCWYRLPDDVHLSQTRAGCGCLCCDPEPTTRRERHQVKRDLRALTGVLDWSVVEDY